MGEIFDTVETVKNAIRMQVESEQYKKQNVITSTISISKKSLLNSDE